MSVKYGREAAFWLVFPDKNESPEDIRSYFAGIQLQLPVSARYGAFLGEEGRRKGDS